MTEKPIITIPEPEVAEEVWELPVLVLAIIKRWPHRIRSWDTYSFKPGRKWRLLDHQTAGVGCHHPWLFATRLTPKQKALVGMYAVAQEWFGSNVGCLGPGLSEISRYNARLRRLFGTDCQLSYVHFEEGLYPIDASRENMKRMAQDKLPADLDDLIEWPSETARFGGAFCRWTIVILGPNSD